MKIKKNIFKGIMLGMTLMTIMSAKLTIAEANNYTDTGFGGFYSGYNTVNTEYRPKEDDSSSYINNSGSPCGVYVDVWGARGKFEIARDGRGMVFYKYDGQEASCNVSQNNVLVGKGQAKKLPNYANERNYNAGSLRMTGTQLRVNLSGLWSPDSI